jgi:hypothetical protein
MEMVGGKSGLCLGGDDDDAPAVFLFFSFGGWFEIVSFWGCPLGIS